jgi:sugar phosphate permease
MVPCEAFIQLRPPASRRGAVIAANNFANFAGMAGAGFVGNVLNTTFQQSRTYTHGFFVLAALAAVVTIWSAWALRGDHA